MTQTRSTEPTTSSAEREKAALLFQAGRATRRKPAARLAGNHVPLRSGSSGNARRPLFRGPLLSCPVLPSDLLCLSYPLNKDYWQHSIAKLPLAPDSTQSQINLLLFLIWLPTRQPTKNGSLLPRPSSASVSPSPGSAIRLLSLPAWSQYFQLCHPAGLSLAVLG